jgi:hypothetical protein
MTSATGCPSGRFDGLEDDNDEVDRNHQAGCVCPDCRADREEEDTQDDDVLSIHRRAAVTLPAWQWIYFAGWVHAHEPVDGQMPRHLREVIAAIETAVLP